MILKALDIHKHSDKFHNANQSLGTKKLFFNQIPAINPLDVHSSIKPKHSRNASSQLEHSKSKWHKPNKPSSVYNKRQSSTLSKYFLPVEYNPKATLSATDTFRMANQRLIVKKNAYINYINIISPPKTPESLLKLDLLQQTKTQINKLTENIKMDLPKYNVTNLVKSHSLLKVKKSSIKILQDDNKIDEIKNIYYIIKIQSFIRGYFARNNYKALKEARNKEILEQMKSKEETIIENPKEEPEKNMIYKGYKKLNKIEYCITMYRIDTAAHSEIEVNFYNSSNNFNTNRVFPLNTILEQLEIIDFNEANYYLLFLALTYTTEISIREIGFNHKFIGSSKKQLGVDYLLRMLKYKEKKKCQYLFECFNHEKPIVASIVMSEKKLKKIFDCNAKNLEKTFDNVLNRLRITEGKLYFIKKYKSKQIIDSSFSIKLISAVTKIQKIYRSHKTRDQILLENNSKPHLITENKILNKIKYAISIYKLEWGLLIEAINTNTNEISYKFIDEPRKYVSQFNKFSDLIKIIQAIRWLNNRVAINSAIPVESDLDPFNSYFSKGPFIYAENIESTDWPVFMKKNINGIVYILKGVLDTKNNVIASFIPTIHGYHAYSRLFTEDDIVKILGINDPMSLLSSLRISYDTIITSDVFTQTLLADGNEILGLKILSKTYIKYESHMFLICSSLIENPECYDQSKLVFYARLNSSLDRCRKTEISLARASECSGIDKAALILIAEYISKNMIVISLTEFYIDQSRPPMNFEKFLVKMQSFMRGYFIRKRIKVKLFFLYKESLKIYDAHFTILIYSYNKLYFLSAVKGIEIYKKEVANTFIARFEETQNKKVFVTNEIIIL